MKPLLKKIVKTALIILLIALIIIQFIRPVKNGGEEIVSNQITAVQQVPGDVQNILKVSCYDCHSNTTIYPWYSKIQPMAWFLNDHIVEGKKELNFSILLPILLTGVIRNLKKFKNKLRRMKCLCFLIR